MSIQQRLSMIRDYMRNYVRYLVYVMDIILFQLLILIAGGLVIAKIEAIGVSDALYFAFVTGFTIGYGDITPHTGLGQVVSLAIGLNGLVFSGLIIAVANRALADTVKQHVAHKHKKAERKPKR
jgi:hypothetical protein